MIIEIQKLHNELGFRISGEIVKQIHSWEYSVDEKVFREQLETGFYKGRYPISPDIRMFMEMAEKKGKIMPYYGAGGSSGACTYKFQITNDFCCLFKVKHSLTGDVFELMLNSQIVDANTEIKRESEMQFSFLPYVTNEKLDKPWSGERHKQLVCKIFGQEYKNLKEWDNWVEEEALSSRYIYNFSQVSMGATGFSVKVEDTETDSIVDVTDYDDW
ncbi:MAG: hypothetical protein QNJ68_03095 [Microcoleaceae cyanobacterium MO_207.B10]|nr:hypothetical protein [Microcoleaceae cyanobacterium MO_207.B10]